MDTVIPVVYFLLKNISPVIIRLLLRRVTWQCLTHCDIAYPRINACLALHKFTWRSY